MSAVAPTAPTATPPAAGRGAGDSPLAVATQMVGADLLKLRRRRGTLIWAMVLGWAPILIMFVVKAIQHSSNAAKYEPAGGMVSFHDGLRLLGGLFFGPLVAILIGVEAGTGDASAGVFRDLVVTGRSRVALFASRVPAALAVNWFLILFGYGLVLAGTFALAGNLPTPSGGLILEGLGFLALATGVLCAVAVGFASLTTSRPAAIIALIAWQVIASPLISSISSLGSAREAILSQAITHFSPITLDGRATSLALSEGTAIVVIVAWLAVWLALGAWRTARMDA